MQTTLFDDFDNGFDEEKTQESQSKSSTSPLTIPEALQPWLVYEPEFLSAPESKQLYQTLVDEISWEQPFVTVFGQSHQIPRLQDWQSDDGVKYQYSGKELAPRPWHPTVFNLKQHIEAFTGKRFNSVLINYYRNGNDKMGWHADNEPELGANPAVVSVSLGAERDIQFKSNEYPKAINVMLVDGSLLMMKAGMQRHFQHQIPARKRIAQPRISLTFRHVLG